MSKTTNRLERIEKQLEELISLMRILVLRGGTNPFEPSEDEESPTPNMPVTPLPLPEPTLPTQPWQPPLLPGTPSLKTVCSKCNMEFEGVMGYVCQDPACPMGCGPVTC